MRFVVCLVGALLVLSFSSTLAAENAAPAKASSGAAAKKSTKKSAKKAKEPSPVAAAPEQDPGQTAVASCKKHIESMLKESKETNFGGGPDLHVQPLDGGNFDVSGWVTSKANSGETKRADFLCHASRFGGGLWTTKTSLSYDR